MNAWRSLGLSSVLMLAVGCGSGGSGESSANETFGYQSSPADGEAGVATTRESILYFDRAVDVGSIEADSFSASVGGNPIDATVYVYKDEKRAALFYPDSLPGDATVTVTVDGDQIRSKTGMQLDGDRDGRAGGAGTFSFDTVSLRPVPGTDACSRVFASELDDDGVNQPLEGVRVSVDGASDSIFSVTGADGRFCLEDAPAGRIFVHIDGTTATNAPPDAYYPSVGKAWQTFAGERVDIGLIHLPAVASTTLQPASQTADTDVTFSPEQVAMVSDPFIRDTLDDVLVSVPADSLFSDDGSRGGLVGIAPVAADRLPGALPPGLELPLVITVQTDGPTNFDEPASVCFMNLPNPLTGQVPGAGDTTGLWSFNHDTGRFEVVGSMTIGDDGSTVCSDPGVGILAPGWHGWADGTEGWLFRPPSRPSCGDLQLDVLQTLRAVGSCLQGVSGIGALAGSIKTMASQLQKLSKARDGIQGAMDAYAAGDARRGDVRNAVTQLRSLKGALNQLIQAANRSQSPLGKAVALLDCAQQAVALARAPCRQLQERFLTCQEEHQALARVCTAVPAVAEQLSLLKTLLQAANAQLKDVAFAAVCAALDRTEAELLEPTSSDERIQDALQDLFDSTGGIPETTEEDAAALDNSWDAFITLTDDTADVAAATEDSVSSGSLKALGLASNAYVKLEVGRAIQRFRSDESGFYRALLPAEAYFAVLAYEPGTGLCGVNVGKSEAAGVRSLFHGPHLGECIAPDSDGDGLPDIAEDIVGTAVDDVDTDGDGIDDQAELAAGTDPGGRSTIQVGALIEGDLAGPGEVDVWRLTVNEPSRFFVKGLGIVTSSGQLRFEWFAPDGTSLGASTGSPANPAGASFVFEATAVGVYTLSISATSTSADGSYRFRVHQSITETFDLHVGEPSFERISTPGDVDLWEFEASAGDELFFDMQELVGVQDALCLAQLRSPSNALLFNVLGFPDSFDVSMDFGPFTLTETGMYTLAVGNEFVDSIYSYGFVLGGLVSTGGGQIVIGATESGMIASAGSSQEWTLDGSNGERLFLDMLSITGADGAVLQVDLIAPDGSTAFSHITVAGPSGGNFDRGPVTLSQDGAYRLLFRSETAGVSYSFALHKPTTDVATAALTVTNAGSLSVPGEIDIWEFSATAGQSIAVEVDMVDGPIFAIFDIVLVAPSGALVFDESNLAQRPGILITPLSPLPESGTYELQFRTRPDSDFTFDYTFRVLP